MELKRYIITLSGCDDSTELDVVMNDEQATLMRELAKQSEEKAVYNCKPTMIVEEVKEPCNHRATASWVDGFGWKCDVCGGWSGNHGGTPGSTSTDARGTAGG